MANANNPNDALRTPNVYSGITSEQGFAAGIANGFSDGIVSGFEVKANSPVGMSVLVGGDAGVKDVLYAKNSTGDMYTIFNGSNSPIVVTIPTAPTANSRIDAIVVYRDVTSTGDPSLTDNPNCVGVMVVSGGSAASPVAPTDAEIRAKLPNGASAVYCVIRTVKVAAGVKAITDSNINNDRQHAFLNSDNMAWSYNDTTPWKRTVANVHDIPAGKWLIIVKIRMYCNQNDKGMWAYIMNKGSAIGVLGRWQTSPTDTFEVGMAYLESDSPTKISIEEEADEGSLAKFSEKLITAIRI